jgi:hypothetical protein
MCERPIVMENKSNRLRDLPKREQDKKEQSWTAPQDGVGK